MLCNFDAICPEWENQISMSANSSSVYIVPDLGGMAYVGFLGENGVVIFLGDFWFSR